MPHIVPGNLTFFASLLMSKPIFLGEIIGKSEEELSCNSVSASAIIFTVFSIFTSNAIIVVVNVLLCEVLSGESNKHLLYVFFAALFKIQKQLNNNF